MSVESLMMHTLISQGISSDLAVCSWLDTMLLAGSAVVLGRKPGEKSEREALQPSMSPAAVKAQDVHSRMWKWLITQARSFKRYLAELARASNNCKLVPMNVTIAKRLAMTWVLSKPSPASATNSPDNSEWGLLQRKRR